MVKRYRDVLTVPNGYNIATMYHTFCFVFFFDEVLLVPEIVFVAHENFISLPLTYASLLCHLVLLCCKRFLHVVRYMLNGGLFYVTMGNFHVAIITS